MNWLELLAVAGVSIGTAAITSLILQKLSENNIWCHVDTRLTNVQRDVLKNELIVDHLKEEVAEHIMDNSRDCEEIIEVLADCDSKIDRLRNNLDKLSVAKIESCVPHRWPLKFCHTSVGRRPGRT